MMDCTVLTLIKGCVDPGRILKGNYRLLEFQSGYWHQAKQVTRVTRSLYAACRVPINYASSRD